MFRHLFMAEFKDDVTEDIRLKVLDEARAIKDHEDCVADLKAGFTTGWAGKKDMIMLTVDVASKEDFEAYAGHPYHTGVVMESIGRYCKPESIVLGQIEF